MAKAYSLVQTSTSFDNWSSQDVTGGSQVRRMDAKAQFFADDFTVDDFFVTTQGANTFQYASFGGCTLTVDTPIAADSYSLIWEYWDGSAWQPLVILSDTTNDLQNNGVVTWEVPHDWNGGAPGAGANYWSVVRCRVTAVTNPTEGGYGRVRSNQFYISCSGGTSGDPITFDNIYEYAVTTLGRSDLVSKFTDNLGNDCYVFYCSVKVVDYFVDSSCMVEWRSTGFWFDDNATLGYCLFLLRRLPAKLYFYTGATFSYVTTIELDGRQRAVEYAGAGTYSRCSFHLGAALMRVSAGYTLSNCKFPSLGWCAPNNNQIVDLGDSYFVGVFYGGQYYGCLKNATYTKTVWAGSGYNHLFVNFNESITSRVSSNTDHLRFRWQLDLKVQDTDGNAIEGANISIADKNGDVDGTHAELTADASSGQKVVTVGSTTHLQAGDSIIMGLGMHNQETKTIDTVDSATQITLTENLTETHKSGAYIQVVAGRALTTNASGVIPTQYLYYRDCAGKSTTPYFDWVTYTPHTLTISKSGYITQTHKITMDEKKDLVFTLEKQVPVYIGKGKALVNTAPENSQNNILA
jgi:hypothetical protein